MPRSRNLVVCCCLLCWAAVSSLGASNCSLSATNSPSPIFLLQHGRFGCPEYGKYVLGVHFGAAFPQGNLANTVGIGRTGTVTANFRVNPRWGWSVRAGFTRFPGASGYSDTNVADLSGNIAVVILRTRPWLFVNGGPGAYYVDRQRVQFGFNAGAGIGYPLRDKAVAELTYNYQSTAFASPGIGFSALQGGILIDPKPISAALEWVKCHVWKSGAN